jgi:uncharacterized protein YlzI (FlbEa/FlbD family)
MGKRKKNIDPQQKNLPLDETIAAYQEAGENILEEVVNPRQVATIESYQEACIQIAIATKKAINKSGLSREQVADKINDYFGWIGSKDKKRSIHIINHYLSKPTEYPIPAYLLFPIMYITGSLEPIVPLAEAMDAKIISGAEVRELRLGKLDELISQTQKLKREIKGGR